MADLQNFDTDLAFVSKLPDSPKLPYQELQAVFDSAGLAIQAWINQVLIPTVNGIKAVTGTTDKTMTRDGAPADAKQVGILLDTLSKTLNANLQNFVAATKNIAYGAVSTEKIADGAVTGDKIASGAVSSIFTSDISTNWSGDGPYTQVISVPGLLSTDTLIVDMVVSSDYETATEQIEAYGSIYRMVASDNSLTVYSTDATSVVIPIQIGAVRK